MQDVFSKLNLKSLNLIYDIPKYCPTKNVTCNKDIWLFSSAWAWRVAATLLSNTSTVGFKKEAALRHNKNGRLVRNNPQFSVFLESRSLIISFFFGQKTMGRKKGLPWSCTSAHLPKHHELGCPQNLQFYPPSLLLVGLLVLLLVFTPKKNYCYLLSCYLLFQPSCCILLLWNGSLVGLASAEDKSTTKPNLSPYC